MWLLSYANLIVNQTRHNGNGIFPLENIKKGSVICVAQGEIIRKPYTKNRYWEGHRWLGIGHEKWVKPSTGNPLYHINHSCDATAEIRNKIEIVARKNILKGEEITIDYSPTEEDPFWKMKCQCHSKNCRGTLNGTAKFSLEK